MIQYIYINIYIYNDEKYITSNGMHGVYRRNTFGFKLSHLDAAQLHFVYGLLVSQNGGYPP